MITMRTATLVAQVSKYYWLSAEKTGTGKAGRKDVYNGRTSAGRMRVGSPGFKHLVNMTQLPSPCRTQI